MMIDNDNVLQIIYLPCFQDGLSLAQNPQLHK